MIGVRRVARPLLAATFVFGGLDALRKPAPKAARVQESPVPLPHFPQVGLTTDEAVVRANGGLMVVAGLALATGRMPRLSASVLAGSLLPTTFAGHPFWQEKEPAARQANLLNFLKNLGMLGGLLLAAVDTEGRASLPRRGRQLAHEAAQSSRLLKKDAQMAALRARHSAQGALPG